MWRVNSCMLLPSTSKPAKGYPFMMNISGALDESIFITPLEMYVKLFFWGGEYTLQVHFNTYPTPVLFDDIISWRAYGGSPPLT